MKLEKLFEMENVSIDLEATHEGKPAKEIFCDYWETTRTGIELIGAFVKNPIVKLIVRILITVGDGISEKICGSGRVGGE